MGYWPDHQQVRQTVQQGDGKLDEIEAAMNQCQVASRSTDLDPFSFHRELADIVTLGRT